MRAIYTPTLFATIASQTKLPRALLYFASSGRLRHAVPGKNTRVPHVAFLQRLLANDHWRKHSLSRNTHARLSTSLAEKMNTKKERNTVSASTSQTQKKATTTRSRTRGAHIQYMYNIIYTSKNTMSSVESWLQKRSSLTFCFVEVYFLLPSVSWQQMNQAINKSSNQSINQSSHAGPNGCSLDDNHWINEPIINWFQEFAKSIKDWAIWTDEPIKDRNNE